MQLFQQLESTGLLNVNWDTVTIPSLLGIGLAVLTREIYYQRKSLKEKDKVIQDLNDKRLEDVRKYSESLRQINDETNGWFNKVMTFLEILKATSDAGK